VFHLLINKVVDLVMVQFKPHVIQVGVLTFLLEQVVFIRIIANILLYSHLLHFLILLSPALRLRPPSGFIPDAANRDVRN